MKVLKFGGTSVCSPQRITEVCNIITKDGQQKLVVLSAMSGTTNTLIEVSNHYYEGDIEKAWDIVHNLKKTYQEHVENLYSTAAIKKEIKSFLEEKFNYLLSFSKSPFTLAQEKELIAQGELISTFMVTEFLKESGIKALLLPALEFMRIDADAEPDMAYIKSNVKKFLNPKDDIQIFITQGFICRNINGNIDNLRRGGSDYTASILGAATNCEEIQIWTDIDGIHNNDPRVVDKTSPVRHLHFEEAAELAYFGAKILHPTCIQPAQAANIPVRLLNTIQPDAPGTVINNVSDHNKIKAVAAKDDITAIRIKSSRMLLAHGFLRKVFEIFETWRTPIDMICTSEVGVSMSIDNTDHLKEITSELKKYGTVSVDSDMCIVCVVGDMDWENLGFESKALNALKTIPVRMISFGGSNYNISFLIRSSDKKKALRRLSDVLFNGKE